MARSNPRWSVRPPHPGEFDAQPIDWQYPITNGLIGAVMPMFGLRDMANYSTLTRTAGTIEPIPSMGLCYRFDGPNINDYLSPSYTIRANDTKTIVSWGIARDGGRAIVMGTRPEYGNYGWGFELRPDLLSYVNIGGSSGVGYFRTFYDNVLYFAAVTTGQNGNDVNVYLDGVLVVSGSQVSQPTDSAFRIGGTGGGSGRATGWMGPTYIWNRILSPSEIWSLYAPQTRWQMLRARSTRRWFTPGSTPPTTSGFRLINGRQHRPGSLVA